MVSSYNYSVYLWYIQSMNRFSVLLLLILMLINCAHPKQINESYTYKNFPKVEFCDLFKYEGKLVYTEAIYSGIDEYWSLNSIKKCKSNSNVEFDNYKDGKEIPVTFKPKFDSVYSSYWNTYLEIKLTGTYESKNPNGYGHLGSNKGRFIVDEIVDVKLIKRR